jgi:endogenous inhibitor of DNA gyrase (YacG/DUF329 family)
MSRLSKCPTCRKTGPWWDGEFGPFCSKRCRLIDLGAWLGEQHVIASPLRPELLADEPDVALRPHPDHPTGNDD